MAVVHSSSELQVLLESSGLLPLEVLAPFFADEQDSSAERIIQQLVRERLLTPFHARQIERDRSNGFFLSEKYKVLDYLGGGGMGRVYLCEHMLLQRLVAVKLLQLGADADDMDSQNLVARFYREARAVAALDHPNIVRVFDVDRLGATPYMVLEYVDGTDLHSLVVHHGNLPRERAVAYIRMAAAGLEHSHQADLIHRDVKPGNILLDRSGVVKLLDLGLARFTHDNAKNAGINTQHDSGLLIGTVDFMAPEQAANSSRVDIRSDIYSLGCTFYFLLTGQAPFPDGSITEKIFAHQVREPMPIAKLCPQVPAELAAVVERMMKKEPENRFQEPGAIIAALAPWTVPAPPPSTAEMPITPASHYRLGLSRFVSPSALQLHTPGPQSDVDTPIPSSVGPMLALPSMAGMSIPRTVQQLRQPSDAIKRPQHKLRWGTTALWSAVAALLLAVIGAVVWQASRPAAPGRAGGVSPEAMGTQLPAALSNAPPFAGTIVTGGGSTFVNAPMSQWTDVYEKSHKVRIHYQPVGSGKGVQGAIDRVYQFGCSDAPLSDDQLPDAQQGGGELIHIPLVMGAVVPMYNLPAVTQQLRFTGTVLAAIYLGKITRWNDQAIHILNPGVPLPDMSITVVHRADSSGTTYIWTDYLSKVSAEWRGKIGTETVVRWPVGVGAQKSNGVATAVSRAVGSIGYVELTYALENNLRFGQVKNREGRYVQPSLDSVTAAATAALQTIPEDLRYTLTDAPGEDSYPLAGTTWAILYLDQTQNKSGRELVAFLRWATHEGQTYLKELRFAPLPPDLVKRIDDKLAKVRLASQ